MANLKDKLREKFSSDLFTQVTDALGDDFNFDVVPRTRLNKVIGQRDQLKEQLEEVVSGTRTTTDPDGDGDDEGDDPTTTTTGKNTPTGSKKKSTSEEDLRKQLQAEKDAYAQELKVQYAVLDTLRKDGAVDPDLALTLIDKTKVSFDDAGKLTGLDDQVTSLKTSKGFLFTTNGGVPGGTGKGGGVDPFVNVKGKKEFLALPSADQLKFKTNNPDLFKSFFEE